MSESPITQWIQGTKLGDDSSEQAIWDHYFQRISRLARGRMFALQGTVYDEEDAALSAMNSLFRGIRADRFPDLHDRHNLWRLLVLITERKLRAQWRRETAQRRGGPVQPQPPDVAIEEVICQEPTPEFVAEMMNDVEQLLGRLGDGQLRRIAVLRMDGFTNDEIAARLGCASRTVARKLERIRTIWAAAGEG